MAENSYEEAIAGLKKLISEKNELQDAAAAKIRQLTAELEEIYDQKMESKFGKIDVEVEVKTPADKFWDSLWDSPTLLPKIFPDHFESIEILEGDHKSVGSISLIKYAPGTFSKEKIESIDEENKTVEHSVIDGETMKYYKSFKSSLTVSPKGDGSLVKWCCEFEKASDEIPDPQLIKDFAVKNFKGLDAYLIAA